ncbi:MAG: hypothetical protein S4CHLAM123_00840 [Chlamydiales bacterium]|nr:hypothetical protein [Chlamydiales bacterium]
MREWAMRICILLVVAIPTQAFCKTTEEAYIVIVLLEAKMGKEAELKRALLQVAEKSRAEKSCLGYCLYQDASNPAKFGLYEKWKSQELHQEQFNKPYIQEFAKQAEFLLAKPYQGLFGVEIN